MLNRALQLFLIRSGYTLGLAAFAHGALRAQCDGCAPDLGCSADPAYPTLCPVQPPDAVAGEFYSTDVTFWLPENFTDPGTGLNVDFMLMTITNVSGLPYGLDIGYSEPSGVYHPQEDQHGCARICGTPISAGTYTITISIIAGVEYNGLPINANEQLSLVLNVLPGTGGNTSFTFTPTTGCGSAEVQFNALINGQGAPVTYAWDFGNGNTGDAVSSTQHYDAPGTYSIALQTTIGGYVLDGVALDGVNDNWCGDVEEPSLFGACTGDPDLYFILTDGNGNTYTSNTVDDVQSASWGNVGQVLGAPPYSIAFYDEDPVSQDDALGTFNMPQGTTGTAPFTLGNGTYGSLSIGLVPQQVFNDTDTVTLFAVPQPALAFDTASAVLCVTDSTANGIIWYNDGDTVLTGNTCVNADSSGTWWATVTNAFGCSANTDTLVICPAIAITQDGGVLYTGTGLLDHQWSWNGTPIAGANDPFLVVTTGGLYAVDATNTDGCALHAELPVLLAGIAATGAPDTLHMEMTDGALFVTLREKGTVGLLDATGKALPPPLRAAANERLRIGTGYLANGTYLLRAVTASGVSVRRFIVTH